jgi:hypothetical protein
MDFSAAMIDALNKKSIALHLDQQIQGIVADGQDMSVVYVALHFNFIEIAEN